MMKINSDMEFKEKDIPEIKETIEKKQDKKEVQSKVKLFFDTFSHVYKEERNKDKEFDKERLFLSEVKELDENTALEPQPLFFLEENTVSENELAQLDEQDAGYVNEYVLDYDNKLQSKRNVYSETGLHTGAINWGDYATKEGCEYVELDKGTVLSRWGDEKGTFMADINTDYEDLEMPIIKEKNMHNIYEVQKTFPAEISKIAKQPWNKKNSENDNENNTAIQYRLPVSVEMLVKEGFLKKL